MPIPLTINGVTYNYPVNGENPEWGNDATDWAQAVTEVINLFVGPGDILDTPGVIDNNISTPTNVNFLLFDTGTVRAANVDYSVFRTSDANPSGYAESGTIFIVFDDSLNQWQLSQRTVGNSGVVFNITNAGQFQYTSTDIGSANYNGVIRFRAKALVK